MQSFSVIGGGAWGTALALLDSVATAREANAAEAAVTVAGDLYSVTLEDERERAAHEADRERAGSGGSPTASVSALASCATRPSTSAWRPTARCPCRATRTCAARSATS